MASFKPRLNSIYTAHCARYPGFWLRFEGLTPWFNSVFYRSSVRPKSFRSSRFCLAESIGSLHKFSVASKCLSIETHNVTSGPQQALLMHCGGVMVRMYCFGSVAEESVTIFKGRLRQCAEANNVRSSPHAPGCSMWERYDPYLPRNWFSMRAPKHAERGLRYPTTLLRSCRAVKGTVSKTFKPTKISRGGQPSLRALSTSIKP